MPDPTAAAPEPARPPLLTPVQALALKARGGEPPKCEHGLPLVARDDGKPRCQMCRKGIPAVAPPEPPAPAPVSLAEVRRRRLSRTPASRPESLPSNVIPFRTRGA